MTRSDTFSSVHRCTSLWSQVTLWLSVDTSSSPASESSGAVSFISCCPPLAFSSAGLWTSSTNADWVSSDSDGSETMAWTVVAEAVCSWWCCCVVVLCQSAVTSLLRSPWCWWSSSAWRRSSSSPSQLLCSALSCTPSATTRRWEHELSFSNTSLSVCECVWDWQSGRCNLCIRVLYWSCCECVCVSVVDVWLSCVTRLFVFACVRRSSVWRTRSRRGSVRLAGPGWGLCLEVSRHWCGSAPSLDSNCQPLSANAPGGAGQSSPSDHLSVKHYTVEGLKPNCSGADEPAASPAGFTDPSRMFLSRRNQVTGLHLHHTFVIAGGASMFPGQTDCRPTLRHAWRTFLLLWQHVQAQSLDVF